MFSSGPVQKYRMARKEYLCRWCQARIIKGAVHFAVAGVSREEDGHYCRAECFGRKAWNDGPMGSPIEGTLQLSTEGATYKRERRG